MNISIVKEQAFIINLCKALVESFSNTAIKVNYDAKNSNLESTQTWLICKVRSYSFAIQAFDLKGHRIRNSNLALGLSQIRKCPILFQGEIKIHEQSEFMQFYAFDIEASDQLSQIANFRIALSAIEEAQLRRVYNFSSQQRLLNLPRINQASYQELSLAIKINKFNELIESKHSLRIGTEHLLLRSGQLTLNIENLELNENGLCIETGAIMENNKVELSLDLLNLEINLSDLNKLTTGTKLLIDCPSESKAFLKIANSRFAEVNLLFTNNGIEMQITNDLFLEQQETFKSNLR